MKPSGLRAPLAAALLLALPAAQAQNYPSKAIRVIVPGTAGSSNDFTVRAMAPRFTEAWGQQIVIDNRSGAGGVIAHEIVAKAAPDGYTLIFSTSAGLILNPLLSKTPYDPFRDLAPVSLGSINPQMLFSHPGVPAKNVPELIALAKAKPGQLNYANSGTGANAHLAAELFKSMTGTSIEAIAYKSAAPALVDLIAGQTHLMFATSLSVMQHIQSGKLRALGVTTAKRVAAVKDLPTIAEAGVPGFEATTWHGVLTTAGTPPAIVNKLNAEINRALQMHDVREKLAGLGAEIVGGTPKEFAEHIAREIPKWAKVVKAANVHIE